MKVSIPYIDRLASGLVQRGLSAAAQEAIDDLRKLGAAADKR
jgi:hypothetical protein